MTHLSLISNLIKDCTNIDKITTVQNKLTVILDITRITVNHY